MDPELKMNTQRERERERERESFLELAMEILLTSLGKRNDDVIPLMFFFFSNFSYFILIPNLFI